MKLSLGIIAYDEVDKVRQIAKKYNTYFDEIVVLADRDIKKFQKINCVNLKVYRYEWSDEEIKRGFPNFDDKRNQLEKYITNKYYFRLDTDDEIINPENIEREFEKIEADNISVGYAYYNYSKDSYGNCNAGHYRETFIRKTSFIKWNKHIHENIIPTDKSKFRVAVINSIVIDHKASKDHLMGSYKRNLKYLLEEYNANRDNADPRTLAYIARMLFAIRDFTKARLFLERHLATSGWDEDRYLSWCQLAELHKQEGRHDLAIAAANEALHERPDYPDAYIKLHDIYFDKADYKKAIEWCLVGMAKPKPQTFMITDPTSLTWRPALSLSYCYYQLEDYSSALKFLLYAKKYAPELDFITDNEKFYREALDHQNYLKSLLKVINFTMREDNSKLENLVKAIPDCLSENEAVQKLKMTFLPPKNWSDKSVVIFCGSSSIEWSPKSTRGGIGGSEEAVIYVSQELTKLGYEVTVFNNCGDDEGNHNGVEYVKHTKFSVKDNYNILISWRVNVFAYSAQAKNKIIWLHDIPQNIDFNAESVKTFDKIMVLSEYHKTFIPDVVPDEKIYVTSNGIVPDQFDVGEIERNPNRIIYASSYDRGLEILLNDWADIKKEIPDAELHVYYGWNTYDEFVKNGSLVDKDFKPRMLELLKQDGVYDHGRVGHKELISEYKKSGVYAYPCTYAGEINCIALTKAIACGCKVVTNDFAVLGERNPYAVDNKTFKQKLLDVLKGDGDYIKVSLANYIAENSWGSLAKDWSENLFKTECEVDLTPRVDWLRNQCPKGIKMVDIGCAEGKIFEDRDRSNITSVDLDDHSYIQNYVNANAEDLPFEDKTFELAVLAEILEHCPNPVKAIKEAARVAKKVVITVPYEHEWREYLDPMMSIEDKEKKEGKSRKEILRDEGKIPLENFYSKDNYEHLWHHRFYTPKTIAEDIEKAGLKKYRVVKLRHGDWSHIGVIVDAS